MSSYYFDEEDMLKQIRELEAQNKKLVEGLKDFRDHGLRADTTPTQPIGDWMQVSSFYLDYLERIESSVKSRAAGVLKELGIE